MSIKLTTQVLILCANAIFNCFLCNPCCKKLFKFSMERDLQVTHGDTKPECKLFKKPIKLLVTQGIKPKEKIYCCTCFLNRVLIFLSDVVQASLEISQSCMRVIWGKIQNQGKQSQYNILRNKLLIQQKGIDKFSQHFPTM